jgi:hypothetical protein
MTEFTAEQIEQCDLSDFSPDQRIQITPVLYAIAPGEDSLAKRRWVANRLRVPIREVNTILWNIHRIQWPARQLKKPVGIPPPSPKQADGIGDFVLDDLPSLDDLLAPTALAEKPADATHEEPVAAVEPWFAADPHNGAS